MALLVFQDDIYIEGRPRLVFELEYLESLPEYKPVKLNIFNTFRDTVLGRVNFD